jgi:hypothetical protein
MSDAKSNLPVEKKLNNNSELMKARLALVALPYGEGPQKIMPLGLQNISAYLKKHNPRVDVRIFDYSESHVSELYKVADLVKWEPTMVGFSVYSSNVIAAKLWANRVLELLPNAFIFCGGPHISLAAEWEKENSQHYCLSKNFLQSQRYQASPIQNSQYRIVQTISTSLRFQTQSG